MSTFRQTLSWLGIVLLGLAHGILEDLMFIQVIVEYMPPNWDLTGDLFFTFTVPLAQLMTLAITGPIAWFLLGLKQLPKLMTFWACWTVARTIVLVQFNNPTEDVLIYLAWITIWCSLLGLLVHAAKQAKPTPA